MKKKRSIAKVEVKKRREKIKKELRFT